MSLRLVGNERLLESVESAIRADRIPHAALIEGGEGLGRHTLARYIAQAAVCASEERPCGVCRDCNLVKAGSHPDISVVAPEDGKKNILVPQIRELRADAFIRPHMARCRVFIIDMADRMNEQSQNALLKVLEEPPEGVIFELIAESRTALLETIVSRCAVMTLLTPERSLALDCLREKTGRDARELENALDRCGGSVGRALALLEKKNKGSSGELPEEFLRLLFTGSELELLRLLMPLEKDRKAAGDFFRALKAQAAGMLRGCYHDTARARVLTELCSRIDTYEELLKTNINLTLLFSAAVCRAKRQR